MSRRHIMLAACALILLTCLAYIPVLNGNAGYIWDDNTHVTANPALHDGQGLIDLWAWGPCAIFDKTTKPATQQYYPVTFTSFWLEYQTWGLDPLGYHVTNVALHLLSAFLLWSILRRLGLSQGVAFVAAALFAVHPVNVESVAWISERKNTLSLVFYLASGLCWIRWNKLGETTQDDTGMPPLTSPTRTGDFAWLFWATLLFVLAILAKSVTATLPAALLLIVWWKRGTIRRMDILGLVPLFVIAVAGGAMTAFIEARYIGAYGPDFAFSFFTRCLIAGRAIWFYLGSLLYPRNLLFIYPRWQLNPALWQQWIPPVGVALVLVALFFLRGKVGRAPLAVVLLFIVSLAPALGFINFYPMQFSFVADHFQYIATIFVCVAAAALLSAAVHRAHLGSSVLAMVAAVCLVLLAARTYQQSKIYHDEQTLYRATLAANPDAWMAAENLAVLLVLENPEKNYPEVVRLYRQTLEKNPRDAKAQSALAGTLLALHQYPEAEAAFRRALAMTPGDVSVEAGLAAALLVQDKFDEAMTHYAIAVRVSRKIPSTSRGMAIRCFTRGIRWKRKNVFAPPSRCTRAASRFTIITWASRCVIRVALARRWTLFTVPSNSIRSEWSRLLRPATFSPGFTKTPWRWNIFSRPCTCSLIIFPRRLDLARLLLISDEPGRADPVWAADLFRQADEETHNQNLGIKIERAAALAAAKFYDQAAELLQQAIAAADPQQLPPEDRERILQLIQKYQLEASPAPVDTSAGAPVAHPDEYSIFQPYPAPPQSPATNPSIRYFPPP